MSLQSCHCLEYAGREVGLDEAGRGSLIGPVVAAAVVWNPAVTVETHPEVAWIRDSKKLSAKKRERLRTFIEQTGALHHTTAAVDAARIDKINILRATFEAMHQALDAIVKQNHNELPFERILVDGNHFRPYAMAPGTRHSLGVSGDYIPHTCIVEGDNTYLSIAAASILAKVTHDEMIKQLLVDQPSLACYNLEKNMGYGTPAHLTALKQYGPSPFHRMSFKGSCQNEPLP